MRREGITGILRRVEEQEEEEEEEAECCSIDYRGIEDGSRGKRGV